MKTKLEKGNNFSEGYSWIPKILHRLSERAYNIQRRLHGDKFYTWTGAIRWTDKKIIEKLLESQPVLTPKPVQTFQQQYLADQKKRQDICLHLKGGRFRLKCGPRDYILTHHRFIDGSERVWCQICQKEFNPKDPETIKMLQQTTNRMSSSETILWATNTGKNYDLVQMLEILKSKSLRFKKLFLQESGLFGDPFFRRVEKEDTSTLKHEIDVTKPYDIPKVVFQDKLSARKGKK